VASENDVAVAGTTVVTDSETMTDDTDVTDVVADEGGEGGDTDTTGVAGDDTQLAPETYAEFNLPEGITADTALIDDATPLFKELGLTQDQAQKLVDFQVKQVEASGQKQADAFNQQLNDWLTDAKADKDFGGDAFDENVATAKAGVDAFGTPEFKQLLDDTGLGNHPEIIRFMVKVGKLTKEDNPGNSSNAVQKSQNPVDLLYPNDRNDKS
jgi:hypothetical protein